MKKLKLTCTACGMRFGGETGFDKHRVGAFGGDHPHYGRRCRTVEEMAEFGFELRDGVMVSPMSHEAREYLSDLKYC